MRRMALAIFLQWGRAHFIEQLLDAAAILQSARQHWVHGTCHIQAPTPSVLGEGQQVVGVFVSPGASGAVGADAGLMRQRLCPLTLSFSLSRRHLQSWLALGGSGAADAHSWNKLLALIGRSLLPPRRKPRPAEPRAQRPLRQPYPPLIGSRRKARRLMQNATKRAAKSWWHWASSPAVFGVPPNTSPSSVLRLPADFLGKNRGSTESRPAGFHAQSVDA